MITQDNYLKAIQNALADVAANYVGGGLKSPMLKAAIANKIGDVMNRPEFSKYIKGVEFAIFDKDGKLDLDPWLRGIKDEIKVAGVKVMGVDVKAEWIDIFAETINSMNK